MKAPKETDLVRQCLDLLRLHGIFHSRCNAGAGVRPDGRGGWRPIKGVIEGTPDVLVFLPTTCSHTTRVLGVECKSATGRLRPAQRAWRDNAQRVGVLYLVVRDVKELEALLRKEGVVR